MEEKESKFSGIFSSLKKIIFTEEFISADQNAAMDEPKEGAQNIQNVVNTKSINAATTSNVSNAKMVEKMYALFESINKPGVDFFELWNAAEAMGGANAINLQNAFTTFKVVGLTKEAAIASGQNYVAELQQKLNEDIAKKQEQKQIILNNTTSSKTNLQQQKNQLEIQLQSITTQLAEVNNKLLVLESNHQPQIVEIDTKIVEGKNALQTVVGEINTVIEVLKNSVN
jgi:hypothetical protein